MPERKSHVKSRLGCGQCKARRVKCDEIRPTCSNCKRRQEPCSYTNRNTKPTSLSSPESNGLDSANGIPSSVHLKQLELMHQYSTSTWTTVALHQGALRMHAPSSYQIDIPRLALENDYLLDTLYALTSLHFASLRPNESHALIQDAAQYHTRALAACREGLARLNAPSAAALYYCSALMGVVTLGFRAVEPDPSATQRPSETLTQLSVMWRGTWSVILASEQVMEPEEYKKMFPHPTWNTNHGSALGNQSQVFLDRLREKAKIESQITMKFNENGSVTPTDEADGANPANVYLGAIDLVQGLLQATDLEHSRVLAWLVLCPVPFMDYLSQKQPLACAIVLLYSVVMRNMDEFWWARNLRRDLVDELEPLVSAIDPEMAELANWVQNWTTRPADLAPIHTENWAADRARRQSMIKPEENSTMVHTPSWADNQTTSRNSSAAEG